MRVALITTTIYVPRVLELYRDIDKDVLFFVAGDRNTPHAETRAFIEGLGNAVYYSDTDQEKLGYKSSEIIGWNRIMRRNIALLEAMKCKADIIISIDDDNIPLNQNYFSDFVKVLTNPFSGLEVTSGNGWFNVGEYLIPSIYHRGFPYEHRYTSSNYSLRHIQQAKIGVAAGLWFGDPDIDAMERITKRTRVTQIAEVLQEGLCVDNNLFAPVNSQNTAFIAELAPLFMVWSGVGRYDDIWASYFAQRIMRALGYRVHYGAPFVWQERNPHNLWQNLRDEIWGMEYTARFCKDLAAAALSDASVSIVERMSNLYEQLKDKEYLPPVVYELGKAWCDDVRRIQ